MAEVNAVVGYLPDAQAKELALGKYAGGPLAVRLNPGSDDVHVRIDPQHVLGTLLGASKKGETAVQVFLTEKANVETLSRASATDLRLRAIKDPSLFIHGPVTVSIFAAPSLITQLVDLQRKALTKG